MKNNGSFYEWNTVSLWERRTNKTMNSQKCSKEKLKSFKNYPRSAKHAFFATKPSRQDKSPNTLETKFLKNFLSVFRDWNVHPQVSREGSRENFCINSRLKFLLSNKSPNRVARTLKTQNFEKISKVFFATRTLTRLWIVKTFCVSSRLGACD